MIPITSPIACPSFHSSLSLELAAALPNPLVMDAPQTKNATTIPAFLLVPLICVLGYHVLLYLLCQFRVWMRAIRLALQMLCIQPGGK